MFGTFYNWIALGAITGAAYAALPEASLTSFLKKQYLVAGKVIESHPKDVDGSYVAKVEITAVYRGPARLKGTTFLDYAVDGNEYTNRVEFPQPPFEKGEVGIWGLLERGGAVQPGVYSDLRLPFLSAVRKRHSDRYEAIKTMAEGIEQLESLWPQQQIELARKFAASDTPELSALAIRALAQAKPEGIQDFFQDLVTNDKLAVPAKIALDEALLGSNAKWTSSQKRMNWLTGWFNRKMSAMEAQSAVRHLNTGLRMRTLGFVDLMRLLGVAANSAELSLEGRQAAVSLITGLAGSPGFEDGITDAEKAIAMKWLTDQVRNQSNRDSRISAAYGLFILASDDRRVADIVKELLATVPDVETKAALRGEPMRR